MSQAPDNKDHDDDGLSPQGQKKVSNLMIGGILLVIAVVVIFVVASAFLN